MGRVWTAIPSVTPARRFSAELHGPAALTTTGASMVEPSASSTPVTRPPPIATPTTRVRRRSTVPRRWAASIRFNAASWGSSMKPVSGIRTPSSRSPGSSKNLSSSGRRGGKKARVSRRGNRPARPSRSSSSHSTPTSVRSPSIRARSKPGDSSRIIGHRWKVARGPAPSGTSRWSAQDHQRWTDSHADITPASVE